MELLYNRNMSEGKGVSNMTEQDVICDVDIPMGSMVDLWWITKPGEVTADGRFEPINGNPGILVDINVHRNTSALSREVWTFWFPGAKAARGYIQDMDWTIVSEGWD